MHLFPRASSALFAARLLILVVLFAISPRGMAQSPSSPRLSVTQVGPQTVEVVWPATPSPFELQRSHSIGAAADWRRIPLSPLARGDQLFVRVNIAGSASFYRLIEVKVPFAVANVAPTDGAGEVGVTYRPKITFTRPANPRSITRDSFFAFAAGQPVQATVVPSGDGSFGWLFFAQPLPGGTRVRVVVDGELIQAAEDGSSLDADGDGRPGGVLEFEFTTVSRVSVPGTVLAGRVVDPGPDLAPRTLDDIGFGAQGLFFRRPIEGVKVFLLGMENQFVFTDSNGWFRLDPVPVGDVKVVLQGQTATTPHPGFYWPEMVMDSRNEPGITNTIQMIGRETNAIQLFLETVYLPRVMSNILQNVSSFQTNVITLQSNAMYDLPPEQQQHLRLEVMPNSLIGANGQPLFNAQVGISVVPPELVRDMLPPGLLQHTFDITVQAPGVATFSTPAPMTFPNVFNAAPGTRLNLLSFDHTTGRLVIEGTATVSADGLTVRTDPGTGITHPGWHGLAPPGSDNGPPCPPGTNPTQNVEPIPVSFGLENYLFIEEQGGFVWSFGNAAAPIQPNQDPCSPQNSQATPLLISIKTDDDIASEFLNGMQTRTVQLAPGQTYDMPVTLQHFTNIIGRSQFADGDIIFGIRVVVQFSKLQVGGQTVPVGQPSTNYIYRYLDRCDTNHSDGKLDFPAALAEGAQPASRARPLIYRRAPDAVGQLAIDDETHFRLDFARGFVFEPRAVGWLGEPLRIVAPGGVEVGAGTLSFEGEGTPRFELFFNSDRLNTILREIAEQTAPLHIDYNQVTPGERSYFDTQQKRTDLVAQAKQRAISKYAPFADALVVTESSNAHAVTVRWDYDAGGGFGIAPPSVDLTTKIETALKTYRKYAPTAQNYLLSDALNNRYSDFVLVSVRDILQTEGGRYNIPRELSRDQLLELLAKTVVHECAHTFGCIHTSVLDVDNPAAEIFINGVSGFTDLMSWFIDWTGSQTFAPNFSREVLKLGLKGDWSSQEAQTALSGMLRYGELSYSLTPTPSHSGPLARISRATPPTELDGGDAHLLPAIDGTQIALLEEDRGLAALHQPIREVILNPNGGNAHVSRFVLRNIGNRDGLIVRTRLLPSLGPFEVSGLDEGTAVPARGAVPFQVTFNPSVSGSFFASLEILVDGDSELLRVNFSGVGVSPEADLAVSVRNNNLGGATLGSTITSSSFALLRNAGRSPLAVQAVELVDGDEFSVVDLPASLAAGNPEILESNEEISIGIAFSPRRTGLRRAMLRIRSDDAREPERDFRVTGTGLEAGGRTAVALDYGNDFVAMESPDFPDAPALRTRSDASGDFRFFLPPQQSYHAAIFDPVSGLIAHLNGISAPAGNGQRLGAPVFVASTVADTDGDGLPDDVEFAIGSDPQKADTDADGVDDFVEVIQGNNPTSDRATSTGIVGRIALGGARHLALHAPDPDNPAALHAYVADGLSGLTILDLSQATTPAIISSMTSLGIVDDVAIDPSTQIAVAVGARVSLVDIREPSRPVLLRQLDFSALEVEAAGGIAYVVWRDPTNNTSHTLRSIDLLEGIVKDEVPLAFQSFSSMTREANFLYLLGDRGLHIVSFDNRWRLSSRGRVAVPNGSGRFSVGNGIAYVPYAGVGGYSTVDVSNPDAPALIQESQAPPGVATPGTIASATGSGVLLLGGTAGFGVGPVIDVMNGAEPTNTYSLVTRFILGLNSLPSAIAPGAGLAFTIRSAGGSGELLVVNYIGIDTRGEPPAILGVEVLADADTSKPGAQIVEGTAFYVRPSLLDDVQVHSVELLVDGRVVQRSATFPFNLEGIAPALAPETSNVTVQVRATDTGGNSVLSELVVAELIPDPIPRTLVHLDPAEGAHKNLGFRQARFLFSDSMGQSAATVENYRLLLGGTNAIPISSAVLTAGDRVLELNFDPLEPGTYELIVQSSNITDRAGNPIGTADFTRRFTVDRYTIRWVRNCLDPAECGTAYGATGSWFQPTNWFPARVPGPDDSVLIDTASTNIIYIISRPLLLFASGVPQQISVKSLECTAQLSLHYINLHVDEPLRMRNRISLNASKLTDMAVIGEANALVTSGGIPGLPYGVTPEGYTAAFDSVRLQGDFKLATSLNILNRLTLDGTIDGTGDPALGQSLAYGSLRFSRGANLDGVGVLRNTSVAVITRESGYEGSQTTVAFGPDITMRGRISLAVEGKDVTFINRGRIISEIPHQGAAATRGDSQITMYGSSFAHANFINEGLIDVRNGDRATIGIQSLGNTFLNRGAIRSTGGAYLLIAGNLVSSRLICEPGAYLEMNDGTLTTPPGQVSELTGGGAFFTEAMEFIGGTVRLVDGAVLEGDATFNNVTFEGELRNYDWQFRRHELPPFLTGYGNIVQVRSNLTLNGTIAFRRALTNFPGYLVAASGQSQTRIDGAGRIVFERANNWHVVGRQGTLDVGPGITIEAGGVLFGTTDPGSLNRGIHSAGTILADRPDSAIYANAFVFTNAGTIRLGSGIIFTNQYSYRQTAEGQLLINAGGTQPGITHGQVKSFSSLTLDGELVLQSESGYEPTAGDALELARGWVSRTGQFASITTATPPSGLEWLPQYGPTNFVLRLVPAAAPVLTSTTSGPDNSITAERDSTPLGSSTSAATAARPHSIAREWNEQNLAAIRVDTPHPPVHARNLFSLSVCMYDAWAAYDSNAVGYIYRRKHTAEDVAAARREAISHAAYRMLRERYYYSRSSNITAGVLSAFMTSLGYRTNDFATNTAVASGVGNSVYLAVSNWFIVDGSRQLQAYADYPLAQGGYTYINPMLATSIPGIDDGGGRTVVDINRWQRLMIVNAVDQNGFPVGPIQNYLGPQWLRVRPFALERMDATKPWIDPGPPPFFGTESHAAFVSNVVEVIRRSSELTPDDGATIDISPGALGNNSLGLNNGTGHPVNPATGQPYPANVVKRGDFARVLAEFWADGPNSETPPGHWNTLANAMTDHPSFEKRISGTGPLLDQLEWDVKMYFALNAALHEAACAAWSIKRYYDAWRPISAVRYLASLGQSTDPTAPLYHTNGLPLIDGLIELVTEASTDGRHAGLMPGTIAVLAWPGQPPINAPPQYQGVKWIAGDSWVPYQKANFVTPAFPGYVSGHSTFSRAAAEVLTELTGSPFFPGGMAAYTAQANTTLTFEQGPSATIELQWGTYYDAADQAGLSRIWGGIHPPADDFAGRRVGSETGKAVWKLARKYFNGSVMDEPIALNIRRLGNNSVVLSFNTLRGFHYHVESCPEAGRSFVGEGTSTLAHDSFLVRTNTSLTPTKVFRAVREPR